MHQSKCGRIKDLSLIGVRIRDNALQVIIKISLSMEPLLMGGENDVMLFWDTNTLTTRRSITYMHRVFEKTLQTVNLGYRLLWEHNVVCGNRDLFTAAQEKEFDDCGFTFYSAPIIRYRCSDCQETDGDPVKEDAAELRLRSMILGRAINGWLPRSILVVTGDCNLRHPMKKLRLWLPMN